MASLREGLEAIAGAVAIIGFGCLMGNAVTQVGKGVFKTNVPEQKEYKTEKREQLQQYRNVVEKNIEMEVGDLNFDGSPDTIIKYPDGKRYLLKTKEGKTYFENLGYEIPSKRR